MTRHGMKIKFSSGRGVGLQGVKWAHLAEHLPGGGACTMSSLRAWLWWAWDCVSRARGAFGNRSLGTEGFLLDLKGPSIKGRQVGRGTCNEQGWGVLARRVGAQGLPWAEYGFGRANKTQTNRIKTTITKKGAYLCGKKQKLCLYLKMGVKGEMSSTWESTEELFVAHCRLRYDKLMLPVWSSYLMQCAALGSVSA